MLYTVMESDLRPLSKLNLLFKYADDTNLIVPACFDIALARKFVHITKWAEDNKMVINLNKTKEIVFRRPSIRHLLAPAPVIGIEQVMCAKLLGVILQQNLSFDDQVDVVLMTCSQRVYLLKLLRDQGIPQHSMDIVFHAMVLSKYVTHCAFVVATSQQIKQEKPSYR